MRVHKKIYIKNSDIKKIKKIKLNLSKDYSVNTTNITLPCDVLIDYNNNKSIDEISENQGISKKTVYNILNKFKEDKNFILKQRRLSPYFMFDKEIRTYFRYHPIKNYKEATGEIIKITNIKRSKTQIYDFLTKAGYEKNIKGFITKYGEKNIKKRISDEKPYLQEHKEEIIEYIDKMVVEKSYLQEHKEEIIKYIDKKALKEPDLKCSDIAVHMKQDYPLITESYKYLEKFIEENSLYF